MKKNRKKINPKMSIAEVISKHPETMEVFLKYGFHCFGCMGASFENLKQAAKVHGVKPADLIRDLEKVIAKKENRKIRN